MKQLVKIKILAIFVASLFILSACDREKMDFGNESDGYGQIQLSSMQLSVDVNATPLSRAVTVDAGSYIVGIYNEDGTTLISEWKYSDMPEIFQLKVGKYKIILQMEENQCLMFLIVKVRRVLRYKKIK